MCVCVSTISPPAPNYAGITSPFNDDLLSLAVKTVVLGSPGDRLLSWLHVCVCMCLACTKHASRITALSNLGCKRAAQAPGVRGSLQEMRGLCLLCSPSWGACSLGAHSRDPGSRPSGWLGPLPLERGAQEAIWYPVELVHTQLRTEWHVHFWLLQTSITLTYHVLKSLKPWACPTVLCIKI